MQKPPEVSQIISFLATFVNNQIRGLAYGFVREIKQNVNLGAEKRQRFASVLRFAGRPSVLQFRSRSEPYLLLASPTLLPKKLEMYSTLMQEAGSI
jgi:hypothetical protein